MWTAPPSADSPLPSPFSRKKICFFFMTPAAQLIRLPKASWVKYLPTVFLRLFLKKKFGCDGKNIAVLALHIYWQHHHHESVTAAVALVLETNMHRGMYGGSRIGMAVKKKRKYMVRENTARREKSILNLGSTHELAKLQHMTEY